MTIRGPLITPVASRRVPQQPQLFCNLLLTTLAVVAPQAPLNQRDWQNPVTVKRVQQPQVTANLQTTTLAPAGAVQAPFRQSDWPNPVGVRRVQQPAFGANLQSTTLAPFVQAPFRQQDWQNPARLSVTLARHVLVTTNYYTEPVAVPGIPLDYQNPTVRRTVQQPQLLPNLVLGAVFPPIRPFDYQNPVRARVVQQNHVFQDLVLNTLFVAPTVPKVSGEFQNPVIKTKVLQPQLLPNLVLRAVFPIPPSVDLQNPIVARRVQQPFILPNLLLGPLFIPPAVEDLRVIVPYLIGDTLQAAIQHLASVYLLYAVNGTTEGTVTAQDIAHMTLIARRTVVTITLGGEFNFSNRRRQQHGLPAFGSPED